MLFTEGLPQPPMPDDLKSPQPVRERDGKQLTVGTAQLQGEFGLKTLPSPTQAKIRLWFAADGWAELTTYRGNLVVDSRYTSRVNAGSTFFVTADQVFGDPSEVQVCTRMESFHVRACNKRLLSPLITRVAQRQIEKRKTELAEQVANRTAAKIRRELANQAATIYTKINQLTSEALSKLQFAKVSPYLSSSSTSEYAEIRVVTKGLKDWQPRPFPFERRGLQVAVHESTLGLLSESMGAKFTRVADVEKAIKSWVQNPKPVKPNGDAIDSVQLVKNKPIEAKFSNGFVHFKLRAEKVFLGKRLLDGVKVEAKYQPKVSNGNIRFVRIGKVNVSLLKPPPKGKMTLQQFTRLEFMRRSFPKMLPTELVLNLNRFGAVEPSTTVECDEGWLTIQITAKTGNQ